MFRFPSLVNRCSAIVSRGRYVSSNRSSGVEVDLRPTPDQTIRIELFKSYQNETLEQKRARLLYQSRKRGMLENDLLLSCFAKQYLNDYSADQLDEYDRMINGVSNDWDLFYWATGKRPVPADFDTSIMRQLQQFTLNESKESRVRQPNL
jgi:succinate dehydrogenase assembly factor 2